ncbi:MAG: exonuclease domain-containing protein [Lachnospiraceae bacterium]|nr:exonuclease domain-containing protein [Lachnospiraceae bacterium]
MSNYIVLDLEWNQAARKEDEIRDMIFEILQIGAVKLNDSFETVDTFDSYVRPRVYRIMNPMTQKLLHMDMKALKRERPFPYVMSDFLDWCGKDPVFCTWGTNDLAQLQSNMDYYGMKPLSQGPLPYIDVQKLFSIGCEDGKSRRSLEYAVGFLEMEPDETFHRALGDAVYTARIFSAITGNEKDSLDHAKYPVNELLKFVSYDTYRLPRNKEEEIRVKFPTYSKYISRPFKTKHAAMRDMDVVMVNCSICGARAKRVVKWFSPSGGKYYLAVSRCRIHGYLKAKNRMKKCRDERVYVVKTVKPIGTEEVDQIRARYENAMLSQRR